MIRFVTGLILFLGLFLINACSGEKLTDDQKVLRQLMKEDSHFQLLKKYDTKRFTELEQRLFNLPVIPTDKNMLYDESEDILSEALFYRFMYASNEDIYEMLAIELEQNKVHRQKDPTICMRELNGASLGYLKDLYPEELVEREERLFENILKTQREGIPEMMLEADAARIFSGISNRLFENHFPPREGVNPNVAACDYFIDLYQTFLDMDPEAATPMLKTAIGINQTSR